jgi:A/G-specific adenine glycosylase
LFKYSRFFGVAIPAINPFAHFYNMDFGSEIIRWYKVNKRDLPWRNVRNPYLIWLSEVILQQTRVDQGLAYYHRFVHNYPTIQSLALAKEDEVLKLWQGLGYYSRARNLHSTAKEIVKRYGGKFPEEYDQVRSLKGIGEYTTGAILSFAFHKKFPVVDGNVYRLLSRYFGIKTPVNSTKAKKEFYQIASELIENHHPADFNQAVMEFGSRQCKPKNPECSVCPLNTTCFAFKYKSVGKLPFKNAKSKIKKRYFNYLVVQQQEKIFLNKRNGKDIWKNLYDFPSIETSKRTSEKKIMESAGWKNLFGKNKIVIHSVSSEKKHQLSHQTIHAKFYRVNLSSGVKIKPRQKFTAVSFDSLEKYAVPRLIELYLENEFR